jgi:hypothetical protein
MWETVLGQQFMCLGGIHRRADLSKDELGFFLQPFDSFAPHLNNEIAVYFLAIRKDSTDEWEVRLVGTALALAAVMRTFAIEEIKPYSQCTTGLRSPKTIERFLAAGYEVSLWRADFGSREPCRILFRDALKHNFAVFNLDSSGHWCACDFCSLVKFYLKFSEIAALAEGRLLQYSERWTTVAEDCAGLLLRYSERWTTVAEDCAGLLDRRFLRTSTYRLHGDGCACLTCTWSLIGKAAAFRTPDKILTIPTLAERYFAKNRLDAFYAFWRSGYVELRRMRTRGETNVG